MAGYLTLDCFTKIYFRDGIPLFVHWDAKILDNPKLTLRDIQAQVKKQLHSCGWDMELTTPILDEEADEFWSSACLKV